MRQLRVETVLRALRLKRVSRAYPFGVTIVWAFMYFGRICHRHVRLPVLPAARSTPRMCIFQRVERGGDAVLSPFRFLGPS